MPTFKHGIHTKTILFLASILCEIFPVIFGTKCYQISPDGSYWANVKNVHKLASCLTQKAWFNYLEMSLQLQHKKLINFSETKEIHQMNIQIFKLLRRTARVLQHSKLVLTHPKLKPNDSFFFKANQVC